MNELNGPRERETKMNEQLVSIWKEANVLSRIYFGKSNTEKNLVRILRSPVESLTDLLLVYTVTTRLHFLFSFFKLGFVDRFLCACGWVCTYT